ncbi:DNA-directed RNA polymerase II subunit RPB1 [Platanthera zijinensis]|uniref:DNA-directed RNA polymerase II subunit RPB1 n=1 Tax=Platanthera zijinensis TaxID=2320716 RepID=A0AAP0G9U5_9ASPA
MDIRFPYSPAEVAKVRCVIFGILSPDEIAYSISSSMAISMRSPTPYQRFIFFAGVFPPSDTLSPLHLLHRRVVQVSDKLTTSCSHRVSPIIFGQSPDSRRQKLSALPLVP